MFWFLGVALLAYVTRSRPVMFLAIVLFLAAVGFRLVPWLEEASSSSSEILFAAVYLSLAAFLYAIGKAKKLYSKGGNPSAASSRPLGCLSALARFTCSPSMTSSITKATVAAA